jgi:hypothetical protein
MKAEDTTYTIIPARETVPLTAEEEALPRYDVDKLYAATPLDKITSFLAGVIPQRTEGGVASASDKAKDLPPVADDLPTL